MISILGASLALTGILGCTFFGSAVWVEMREVFDGKRLSGTTFALQLFATLMCALMFAGGVALAGSA